MEKYLLKGGTNIFGDLFNVPEERVKELIPKMANLANRCFDDIVGKVVYSKRQFIEDMINLAENEDERYYLAVMSGIKFLEFEQFEKENWGLISLHKYFKNKI